MAISAISLILVHTNVTEEQLVFVRAGEMSVPVPMCHVTQYSSFLPILNSEAHMEFIQGIQHIFHIHVV